MSAVEIDAWLAAKEATWPPMGEVERRRLRVLFRSFAEARAGAPPGHGRGPVPSQDPGPHETSASRSQTTDSRRCQDQGNRIKRPDARQSSAGGSPGAA